VLTRPVVVGTRPPAKAQHWSGPNHSRAYQRDSIDWPQCVALVLSVSALGRHKKTAGPTLDHKCQNPRLRDVITQRGHKPQDFCLERLAHSARHSLRSGAYLPPFGSFK
jgi:hypothetical protein